jgi:hypothetical protein
MREDLFRKKMIKTVFTFFVRRAAGYMIKPAADKMPPKHVRLFGRFAETAV